MPSWRGWCAVAPISVVAGAAVIGLAACGSDSSARYQADLSSVQAKQATAEANERFASDFVLTDQRVSAVQGKARAAQFDALIAMTCPGSGLGGVVRKNRAERMDSLPYFADKRTVILGAHIQDDPNNVIVVAKNTIGGQDSRFAMRVELGNDSGRLCATNETRA